SACSPWGTQFRAPETVRVRLWCGLAAPLRDDHVYPFVNSTAYARQSSSSFLGVAAVGDMTDCGGNSLRHRWEVFYLRATRYCASASMSAGATRLPNAGIPAFGSTFFGDVIQRRNQSAS